MVRNIIVNLSLWGTAKCVSPPKSNQNRLKLWRHQTHESQVVEKSFSVVNTLLDLVDFQKVKNIIFSYLVMKDFIGVEKQSISKVLSEISSYDHAGGINLHLANRNAGLLSSKVASNLSTASHLEEAE